MSPPTNRLLPNSFWKFRLELAVDGEIGVRAVALPDFHADPADRLIVATALRGHLLITADERIRDWPGEVSRLDARR